MYFTSSLWDIFNGMLGQEVLTGAKEADATLYGANLQQMVMSPTVFGTMVISTVLVFPVVILVFCRMTLFESFWGGVFPAVAVDVSACTALSAVTPCRGHQCFQICLILSKCSAQLPQIKGLQVSDSGQSEGERGYWRGLEGVKLHQDSQRHP